MRRTFAASIGVRLSLQAICLQEGKTMTAPSFDLSSHVALVTGANHSRQAFANSGKNDEAAVKKVLADLKGVYVRSFEFETVGAYSDADLKPIRDQLRGKEWKAIVSVHEKDDNIDILVRQEGDKTTGLILIAPEAKEVTVINIEGNVNLQTLSALGGQFGIPKVESKAK
jgi:hypothetical protein